MACVTLAPLMSLTQRAPSSVAYGVRCPTPFHWWQLAQAPSNNFKPCGGCVAPSLGAALPDASAGAGFRSTRMGESPMRAVELRRYPTSDAASSALRYRKTGIAVCSSRPGVAGIMTREAGLRGLAEENCVAAMVR